MARCDWKQEWWARLRVAGAGAGLGAGAGARWVADAKNQICRGCASLSADFRSGKIPRLLASHLPSGLRSETRLTCLMGSNRHSVIRRVDQVKTCFGVDAVKP